MTKKQKFAIVIGTVIGTSYFMGFLSIVFSEGENWKYLIWHTDTVGIFPDLAQTVCEEQTPNPYSGETGTLAIYPPFTYLFFSLIAKCIPGDITMAGSIRPIDSTVYSYLWIVAVSVLGIILFRFLKCSFYLKCVLFFAILFSEPFCYNFERGNIVIFSVIFCTVYLLCYDSANYGRRSLAFLCLAMAVSMKLYPAVFGVLLLLNKQYKDVLRCSIYGLCFLGIPFLLIQGDAVESINRMLDNIDYFTSIAMEGNEWGYGFRINIYNWVHIIGIMLDGDIRVVRRIGVIASIIFCLFTVISVIFQRKKWKKITILSLFIILFPYFSWVSNILYLVPAIMFYVNDLTEKNDLEMEDVFWTIAFWVAFVPLPYGEVLEELPGIQKVSLSTLVSSISMIMIFLKLSVDTMFYLRKGRGNVL